MTTPPYVRFYANDWFTGVSGLKADERGVYISMCVYIWTTGKRVPLCDAEASRMMGLQFNNYQRLRDRLVVKDKVQKHADGYGITRAETELDLARDRAEAGKPSRPGRRLDAPSQNDDAGAATSPDPVRPQHGEGPQACDALLGAPIGAPIGSIEISEENQTQAVSNQNQNQNQKDNPATPPLDAARDAALAALKLDWKSISTACLNAIGEAADPLAIGLMAVNEPLGWIANGADLDADVLPAIRKLAAQKAAKGERIGSWAYFAKAVAANRASRIAGLPAVEAPKVAPKFKLGRFGQRIAVTAVVPA